GGGGGWLPAGGWGGWLPAGGWGGWLSSGPGVLVMAASLSAGPRAGRLPRTSRGRPLRRTKGAAAAVLGWGSGVRLDLRPLALDVLEATAHEEGLLADVVVLAVADLGEGLDGLRQRDRGALDAGELLGDIGVLREEPLDATGPVDDDLVLLGQLIDTEDRDDVLQLLVLLQDRLHAHRGVVVVRRDVPTVEDPAARGQRVHGRVDALRGDLTGELRGRVEVGEGRRRRRVGVVVGGDVDRLHRG